MPQPQEISRLRTLRDAAQAAAIAAEGRMQALDAAIARAERAGLTQDVARLRTDRALARREALRARADYTRFSGDALSALGHWLEQPPEQMVNALSDQWPFVLLPVRIETSFAPSPTGPTLRVRFYPDDISVPAPLAAVSDEERALGMAYWKARSASRHAAGNDAARRAYEGAWTTLATRSGAYRAGYVVRAIAPSNPDAAPGDLHFTDPAPPVQPPVARADLLPDRFVVLAYIADPTTHELRVVVSGVGAPIPDNLVLAPESDQPESFLSRDEATGRLVVPPALKWMVDYDAAVAVGMAVTIWLSAPFTQAFDRVIALGVRGATPPEEGPAALQALLEKHRYGHGCALLPAGTPTNNTETPSGWQPPSLDAPDLFTIEDAPPDLTPGKGVLLTSDGWRLGQLFGFDNEFVRRLPNAARTDIAEALAMNRAAVAGTLDDFIDRFLKGVVSPQTAADLHTFFVSWASGRGHYPALRIGRQPYGVVVTSAWRNWRFPPEASAGVVPALYNLIGVNRFNWQLLAHRAPHAAQPGSDPFQRLLSIIGLLASSTEFVSRKAVSDEYIIQRLSFGGADAASVQQWFGQLRSVRDQNIAAANFAPGPISTDPLLAFIVFKRETTDWRLPIVDRDPAVPLSENSPIAPYDGSHNYLWWLTQASRDDLMSQRFADASGAVVPSPTALLYVILRRSVLAALESGAIEAAELHGAQLFQVVERDPLIANIGDAQHVQRRDYLSIDASRLGLASTPTPLVDWTLAESRLPSGRPAPAERLAEVQQAITVLANLPTARLERLFAEHLDLCSYRLDSWITAIYAQRLAALRSARPPGLYLGAFGWVENLRANSSNRIPVAADALPEPLRDAAGARIFQDIANGGYIHAPSLAQAASAAVLRNGYISHASSAQPLPFSVNLSSARMRAAMSLADGVRAGQSIAALLGYQFERGLHEGHPGVELDRFIAPLRDRFPLLSGRLTEVPQNTSADVIEARNVVDGLALVEATSGQAYPYGVNGLPAAGSTEGVAIRAEVDRLRDALDAVSDLMISESVHQAVHGNLARTQAAQQALTSPAPPPEPEIVDTPRSGRVLTFRMMLALDGEAVGGWTSVLSPRGQANPQLNHWLSRHLPAPGNIQWTVKAGTTAAQAQSLDGLGLEAIDLVLMSGDRLGDQSSELERYLIRHFRWKGAVPDDQRTVVAPADNIDDPAKVVIFDFSNAASGKTSLASLQPLLTRLRRIVTRSRAAHAADWRRSVDTAQAAPGDPTGSATGLPPLEHFKDLTDRVSAAKRGEQGAHGTLKNALSALGPLRTALDADPATIDDPSWTGKLEDVRRALFAMVPYGIPEAVPADGLTVTPVVVDRLVRQATVVSKIADDRLRGAGQLLATAFTDPLPADDPARTIEVARRNDLQRQALLNAARALLGQAFVMLPLYHLTPGQAAEVKQSLSAPPADAVTVEDWLFSVSRVRPQIADLVWALAATRWTGHPIADAGVVQFPHRPGIPWIGGTFGDALAAGEWLSLAVLESGAATQALQAGLLIDDWTETVPADRETTAVAFNFNRPNAVAPQAVLVAVPPDLRGHWIWDDLVGSVNEAIDLAKIRAVEPEALLGKGSDDPAPSGAYFQVLPALLSEFTAGRLAVTDFASIVATALAQRQP